MGQVATIAVLQHLESWTTKRRQSLRNPSWLELGNSAQASTMIDEAMHKQHNRRSTEAFLLVVQRHDQQGKVEVAQAKKHSCMMLGTGQKAAHSMPRSTARVSQCATEAKNETNTSVAD
jgi:hypothetical protein